MAELAPKELINQLRRPKTIFTEAYLEDPIKFETDERFHPETVLRQLEEITVIDRDGANFAVVDTGATGSIYYAIPMFSPVLNRDKFLRHIDTKFDEF